MILTKDSRKKLREGIVNAYTEEDDLVILLRESMDINFNAIAQGKTYEQRVFYLLGYLESKNILNKFVETVGKDKPDSPYLQDSLEYIKTSPQAKFNKKILLILIPLFIIISLFISNLFNQQGYKYYTNEKWGKAKNNYHLALIFNPKNAEAHLNLGLVYEELNNSEQARYHYQKAWEAGIPAAMNNLARLEILNNQPGEAINLLLQAQSQKNLDKETSYAIFKNIGWARLKQKDYPSAESSLLEAIALQEDQASAYCLLAQVKEADNKQTAALKEWEKCNQYANPTNPDEDQWRIIAQNRLASIK